MAVQTFIIIAQRHGLPCRVPAATLEQTIVNVLRTFSSDPESAERLVGAHARIVRHPEPTVLGALATLSVAWPFQTPDVEMTADAQHQMLQAITSQLATALDSINSATEGLLCPGWTVHVQPFDPTLNGPLSWWQSGAAANTTTRDLFVPSWVDFLNPLISGENFVGPDRPIETASAIAGSGEGTARALAALETVATTTLWIGLGGVALYGLYKIVKGSTFEEPPYPQLGPGPRALPAPERRLTFSERHARTLPGLQHGYR